MQQAADAILRYYRSQPHLSLSDSLRSADTFRADFASKALPGTTLSPSDIKVLIKYLERDRRSIVTDKEVVKFIDTESDEEGAHIVTQVDRGVLEMKLAVAKLQAQIDSIQQQIEE